MWRRSFSSKLLSHKSNPKSSLILYDILPPANSFFNHQYLYSSSLATPSSGDPIKLGFRKSDAISSFAATALVGHETASSLVFSKVSALLDSARHYGRCYWELSKARLSMLVVATSGTGYVLGSGSIIDFSGLCFTCAGTMMVAASANSLNQVFEVKNDARMKRTMNRPLPSGRITVPHAVTWASCVGIAGTALIACKANELAAGLAASNLILYAFVYTPLKQIHPVNTWVGAVVGAIPPLLGWAAASGQVSLNAMILPAALYFWQIPHFMALAYLCRDDYAAGGFKMFSLADATGKRTALVALRNCLYLVPLGFLAHDWGITTGWFSVESSILAAAISATAFSFYRKRTRQSARRMFHASLLYLPVFMSGLLFHRISDNHHVLKADSAETIMVHLSSSDLILQEDENDDCQKKPKLSRGNQGRPPVAYASVAPFPFLPAPSYVEF